MFSLTISLDSKVSMTDSLSTALVGKEKNSLRTITFVAQKTYSQIQQINEVMNYLQEANQLEFLEEVTFQIRANDSGQILEFVKIIGQTYKNLLRIRRDFYILSFDNELLDKLGLAYNFQSTSTLLRQLVPLRKDNMLINLTFVAFGIFRKMRSGQSELRDRSKREFFFKLLDSGFIDSRTVYPAHELPAIPYNLIDGRESNDDLIQEELGILTDSIIDAGYRPYSNYNYSRSGANSIALHYQHEEQIFCPLVTV